jgi:hypothetical protein
MKRKLRALSRAALNQRPPGDHGATAARRMNRHVRGEHPSDGVVFDSFVTGHIENATTIRSSLSANGNYGSGTHELRILITRPALPGSVLAQYVDDQGRCVGCSVDDAEREAVEDEAPGPVNVARPGFEVEAAVVEPAGRRARPG